MALTLNILTPIAGVICVALLIGFVLIRRWLKATYEEVEVDDDTVVADIGKTSVFSKTKGGPKKKVLRRRKTGADSTAFSCSIVSQKRSPEGLIYEKTYKKAVESKVAEKEAAEKKVAEKKAADDSRYQHLSAAAKTTAAKTAVGGPKAQQTKSEMERYLLF